MRGRFYGKIITCCQRYCQRFQQEGLAVDEGHRNPSRVLSPDSGPKSDISRASGCACPPSQMLQTISDLHILSQEALSTNQVVFGNCKLLLTPISHPLSWHRGSLEDIAPGKATAVKSGEPFCARRG